MALSALRLFLRERHLVRMLARRELASRYRASWAGALWPWLTPLLMLAVFSFVFGNLLSGRWPRPEGAPSAPFVLLIFTGLLLSQAMSELLAKAPGTVIGHVNYVKKVVFPLDVLALVDLRVAGLHLIIGVALLLAAVALSGGAAQASWLAIPLVLAPLLLLFLGLSWALQAMGVYIRDLGQLMAPALTALTFLSPVFYPRALVPEPAASWMLLNPLTIPVEQLRRVVFDGLWPEAVLLGTYAAIALLVCMMGHALFKHLRRGFADVL